MEIVLVKYDLVWGEIRSSLFVTAGRKKQLLSNRGSGVAKGISHQQPVVLYSITLVTFSSVEEYIQPFGLSEVILR